ncbi:hypothetical protein HY734_01720 [Candidatus Uhrbacteria bacterium]|nr:hypothetical protein [Candidatus Uhrbacteria bacterium]
MFARLFFRMVLFLIVVSTFFPNLAQAQESETPPSPTFTVTEEILVMPPIETSSENISQNRTETEEEEVEIQKDFSHIIRQTTAYTCGPAALATLIGLLGSASTEMQIMELAGTSEEKGTSMLGLKRAAKEVGFNAVAKNMSVERLSQLSEMSLAFMRGGEGVDHYVVIKRFEHDTFFVADPAEGNVHYAFEDFADSYSGKILLLSFRLDTPIVDPLTGDLVPLNVMSTESLARFAEEIADEELSGITGKNPLAAATALIAVALKKYAVQLTVHAAERMVQYAITTKAVHTAMQSGQKYVDPAGKSIVAVKDRVAVVLSPEMRVITVYTIDKIKSRWLSFDQLRLSGIRVGSDLTKIDVDKLLKQVGKYWANSFNYGNDHFRNSSHT